MSAVVEVTTPVSFDDVISAYERDDFATALGGFRSLAGQGDQVAQFYFGRMFARGEGVMQDHAAAAAWYRRSAEQGYFKAQHNLAIAYQWGVGVPCDLALAAVWFRRAAEQGSSKSQYSLGLAYLHGTGVLLNYAEAAAWLRKAANQENGDAEYMLGQLYRDGNGVSQDNALAACLFRKAADRGVVKAQCALAALYMFGIGTAQDYSEALAWYRRAAEQNDPDALRGLGLVYEGGHGVPADAAKALSCYRQAADLGDAKAQTILGYKYQFGTGVPEDPASAIELYRKAADQGYAEAQYALGGIYADATGVPRDYVEAAKWFRKAADQGFAKAQFNLGLAFLHAQGVPQDLSAALYWFREAGDRGDSHAQNSLGLMYLRGEGTTQDYAMAAFWFGKAANQGNIRSQWFLGHMYLRGDGVPQDHHIAYVWLTLAKAGAGEFETRETLEAIDEALAETAQQLTASQLAEAQELVRQWKPKSAAQSVNEAAFAATRAWRRSDIVLAAYSYLGADEWRGERAFAGGSIVFPDSGRAAALTTEARQALEAGRSPATIIPLLDEALRLNYPDAIDGDIAVTRSEIYAKAGLDEPLRAIELYNIGVNLAHVKLWREAAFVYQAAADIDPLFAWHLNNLAWMASTASDVRAHAGQYSVVAATRACEISGWACWHFIGTLAAAFARAGDFRRAAEWQRISLCLAPEREKAEAQEVLRQFETGEAHVDHDRKPAAGAPGPSDEELAQIDVEALLSRAKELIGTSRRSVQ